ncbi:MAG: Sapep family Mn(2+)-dependent dipeptidase [Fusobacterium mortiferum]|jgi:succinyl-diaminopimelate desuccinylase|uniref:M20/M25/M40 family metallo-hydrolase n=1 Tax=Fusobacterium mortiferum TaxID=850 RepID=A0A414PXS6_FUSMR|nr:MULTISPECIES: Sapep family Mn(2+)-dependent dipeptidase [Fusobacterium]MCF2627003.1 Sapep family Mn(2+)-dependent dipeptidase [Fusobacterium mortiferum]MCF2698777.1 Sapep family Mn(2+)-dependent dipeptidase [Fusobacterium mortiferum]MCI6381549.1 Sapep family Mn(2+)-dependent dipeptidase [Fusobacterium mortiferum]MCI7186608.1 Sapep family Mn(2+)-dependent dipeptidase [Fusobacterium mortiferum]MCI7664650.1 Sapep family Mn(2+)-dependent dipeptidase [Fusobacterium mortiferum]
MNNNNYYEKLENNFSEFLNNLDRVVSIPSYYQEDSTKYPFGENIQKVLEEMIDICKELGFRTYIDSEGYYGYAEIGSGEKLVGVLGHLDVVPPGDLSKWENEPFKPVIKDGKYYGRGAQDDKGPTLAAIYALKTLLDCGFKLKYRVRFIFGTDEENLWRDMPKYVEKEEIPTVGFTPDSKFPLIYSEKGLLQCKLIAKNESGLVFKGGDAFNSVPSNIIVPKNEELMKVLLELNYEFKDKDEVIEIVGKSVHAQVAETGINAINRYMHALTKLGKETKSGKFITENLIGYDFAEPIFELVKDEHSGELKFNVGKIEFTEENEILMIDMRIPVTYDKEKIVETLSRKAKEYGFEYIQHDYLKSIYVPLDSELITTLMSAYQEITGDMESQPVASGGATYARAMNNCVAFGCVLPGSPKTEHQPNEYIILDDIKKAMKIYMKAFEKFNK